ncbi:hypothetical protein Ancab_014331 [Ancistrocladus abbreviatus]
MMTIPEKHLKELLKEDQEPFHLNGYIADRRSQVKKQSPINKTELQIKKPKTPSFPSNFCKNACFFSSSASIDSPDPRKSPLFDFSSSPAAANSPFNSSGSNALFLHVPTKTAALLLEAAMRIQTQYSKPKTRSPMKNSGLALLGSMLKKLTNRNRSASKWAASATLKSGKSEVSEEERKAGCEMGLSNGRLSSVSSESNNRDDKYLEFLKSRSNSCSSSSGRSFEDDDDEFEEVEFANMERENWGNFAFCLSPLSPFRFGLYKSPSPNRRSPSLVLASPAASPVRRKFEEKMNNEHETTVNLQEEEDEEDKEHDSPVSVLDPPFGDDDDDDDDEGPGGEEDENGYDIQCSYAHVQKLDPVELEKRLVEQEREIYDESPEPGEYEYENCNASLLKDVFGKFSFCDIQNPGMKRLVSHLMAEEEDRQQSRSSDQVAVVKRMCKRLESWKEVGSNTIDMMVEMDLRREIDEWRKPNEQTGETVKEVEHAILAILVGEMLEELI